MLLLLLLRLHRPINNVCEQDQRTAARTPQAPKGGHQHELRTLQKISDLLPLALVSAAVSLPQRHTVSTTRLVPRRSF